MFVPGRVAAAAGRGDLARVQSWLNNAGPGAVNYACVDGYTCLLHSVSYNIRREDVELARFLISRGADVNLCDSLLVRRRAITKDNCLERIARLPNGACWKVLSYWREDN